MWPPRSLRASLSGRLTAEQRRALADAWRAAWTSRAVVWAVGILGVLKLGVEESVTPPPITRPFGSVGNLLVAPATSWDAGYYLQIADQGYFYPQLSAFFPLYPLSIRGMGWLVGSDLIAAILISLGAFLVALYLFHRLVDLELGEPYARPGVWILAFSPMAFFFSAVYTEGLFLALTLGAVYAGRRGRWVWAGALGALAAATRNTGVLVLLPLAVLYLYGPRADRPSSAGGPWWRPRHPLRSDALSLLAVPAGLAAYLGYMAGRGDALAPSHATEKYWNRHLEPLAGIWQGIESAFDAVRLLASDLGTRGHPLPGERTDAFRVVEHSVLEVAFLALAVVALVGVFRRLPLAYGLYSGAAVLVAVSFPDPAEPLVSLPRYLAVIFPLWMWLTAWAVDRGRSDAVVAVSAVMLGLFSAEFASWHWVA